MLDVIRCGVICREVWNILLVKETMQIGLRGAYLVAAWISAIRSAIFVAPGCSESGDYLVRNEMVALWNLYGSQTIQNIFKIR